MLEALSAFKGMDLAVCSLLVVCMAVLKLCFNMKNEMVAVLKVAADANRYLGRRLRHIARVQRVSLKSLQELSARLDASTLKPPAINSQEEKKNKCQSITPALII